MSGLPPRFHLIAVVVGLATAVASTWPVAAHLRDHVIDGARLTHTADPESWGASNLGADVLLTVWIVSWNLHALVTQPFHLFDANIFYPTPRSLARSEHLFATSVLGAPGMLFGGPVVAHQTALLLTCVLTVWATAYVITRWSGSLVGGLTAGVLFALCPFRQNQLYHLQSLGTAYFPLMLFGLGEFAATGAWRWAVFGSTALALEVLSGQYLAFFALVAWFFAGVVAVIVGRATNRPLRRMARDASRLAGTTAVAILATLPFVIPYVRLLALGELPDNTQNVWITAGSVRSASHWMAWGTASHTAIAAPTWALALIGVVSLLRRTWRDRLHVMMLMVVALVGVFLAAGPGHLYLYDACVRFLPGFRVVREPWRAAVLLHLAVAMLAGCGVAVLAWDRVRVRGGLAALGAVAFSVAMSWRAPVPLAALPVGPALPAVYRFLARCGEGDPLLELPAFGPTESWRETERQLLGTFHWLPLLNGRTGYPPPSYAEITALAARVPDADAIASLRARTGLRWVLVHCAGRRQHFPQLQQLCPAHFRLGLSSRSFGDARLYDLGRSAVLPAAWTRRWNAPPGCQTHGR
jgi:hypothetical protein